MSDAEFRALFTRFDPPVEPEFVEQLLADIDRVISSPGAAPGEPDSGVDATPDFSGTRPQRPYLVERDGQGPLAFAWTRRRKRHVIGALAAAAAIILATVAVVVTGPGAHQQSKPGAPAPATVPPSSVVPPPLPAPASRPQLYWRDAAGIGRANPDGTGITRDLIPIGGEPVCSGTLAADRNYVYWANPNRIGLPPGGEIARARRDGTGVDEGFIATSPYVPQCVAVDGAHVYWTAGALGPTAGATAGNPSFVIGRANLDGTGVQESFISGITATCLAVDGAYIYWGGGNGMGRANLDGTAVNPAFIRDALCGFVIDGAHIYSPGGRGIIRFNLDGTGGYETFVSPGGSGTQPCAHDSTYLYWLGSAGPGPSVRVPLANGLNSIGRARIDGTGGVQDLFITGLNSASGCAIGP